MSNAALSTQCLWHRQASHSTSLLLKGLNADKQTLATAAMSTLSFWFIAENENTLIDLRSAYVLRRRWSLTFTENKKQQCTLVNTSIPHMSSNNENAVGAPRASVSNKRLCRQFTHRHTHKTNVMHSCARTPQSHRVLLCFHCYLVIIV